MTTKCLIGVLVEPSLPDRDAPAGVTAGTNAVAASASATNGRIRRRACDGMWFLHIGARTAPDTVSLTPAGYGSLTSRGRRPRVPVNLRDHEERGYSGRPAWSISPHASRTATTRRDRSRGWDCLLCARRCRRGHAPDARTGAGGLRLQPSRPTDRPHPDPPPPRGPGVVRPGHGAVDRQGPVALARHRDARPARERRRRRPPHIARLTVPAPR